MVVDIKERFELEGIKNISPSLIRGLYQGLSVVKIRRSALSPFLTACLLVSIPCFFIGVFCRAEYAKMIFFVGTIPLALFAFAALFLLFFDRERLHSEEHLEKKQALEIVETKTHGLQLNPVDLVDIVNPAPDMKKLLSRTTDNEGGQTNE